MEGGDPWYYLEADDWGGWDRSQDAEYEEHDKRRAG